MNYQNVLRILILSWCLDLADQVTALLLDLNINRSSFDPRRHALLVALHSEDRNGNLKDQSRDLQVEGLEEQKVGVLGLWYDLRQGALIL